MSRPVSQETYNSVVRENLDEFDMSPEEAVEDAAKQLEAQGVSLGLIVRDLPLYPEGQHPLMLAVAAVVSDSEQPAPEHQVCARLAELSSQLAAGLPHRVLAAQSGATAALLRLSAQQQQQQGRRAVACAALRTLRRLLKQQSDALSSEQLLALLGRAKGLAGEEATPDKAAAGDAEAAELTALLGVLGSACVLNEANRQLLVSDGLVPLLAALLESQPDQEALICQACRLLRLLTLDDDVRAVVGQAHERARHVMSETPALSLLLRLCRRYDDRPESRRTVARVFDTLACLAVRDEFCQRALELGACDFIVGALCAHSGEPQLAASGMGLLRNLARNDQVKRAAAVHLPELIDVAVKFAKQPPVVHQFLGLTANLCLRQPGTARRLTELQGPALLAQLAALHRSDAGLMRQLCMCVRNAAARDDAAESGGSVRPAMLEQGLERTLNELLPLCEDEAKAALLALDCEVAFKPMLWTGRNGQLPRD